MSSVQLTDRPALFRKSWQYRKIVVLHGRRLAALCVATLLWLREEAAGVDVVLPHALAMSLAEGADRRVRRRVLWALEQANVLHRVEGGYRLWELAQPPVAVRVARQPTAQMALGLVEGGSGSRSTFEPGRVVLDPVALTADVEKVEQNQASGLARAGAYSSTQGDDAPPIDPAPSCTEFLQASAGALAPGVLAFDFTGAQAKKPGGVPEVRGLPGGISRQQSACPIEAEPSEGPSSGLQPLARVIGRIMPSRCTVERAFEPPSRIEDLPSVTQPVNTQRVIKQQKVVRCRKPSSTAVSRDRLEGDLTPPTLYPTTADIVSATREAWPDDPLSHKKAEEMMLKQTTWDELRASIEEAQTRMDDGRARSPGVLVWMVDYVRQKAEAKADKSARRPPQHVHRNNAERCTDRRSLAEAINRHLGEEHQLHHCSTGPYLDAMLGKSAEFIVSVYSDLRDVPSDERWDRTSEAIAEGREPSRLGRLPTWKNDDAHIAEILRRFDVQLPAKPVDKTAQAG